MLDTPLQLHQPGVSTGLPLPLSLYPAAPALLSPLLVLAALELAVLTYVDWSYFSARFQSFSDAVFVVTMEWTQEAVKHVSCLG